MDRIFSDIISYAMAICDDDLKDGILSLAPSIYKEYESFTSEDRERLLNEIREMTELKIDKVGMKEKEDEISGNYSKRWNIDLNIKTQKSSTETDLEQVLSIIREDIMLETVYTDDGPKFVKWESGSEFTIVEEWPPYTPLYPEVAKIGMLKMPMGIEEYGDPSDLASEIREHIHKYVDIPEKDEKFCSWYVMFTWLFGDHKTLSEVPYLRFRGDISVGKSRATEVIGDICYHSFKTTSTITEAALFRTIKKYCPTMVIDEADMENDSDKNNLVTLLLDGFSRNGGIIRCHKEDQNELVCYSSFGPKIFGSRFDFGSKALETRCWTVSMRKTLRRDIPPKLPMAYYEKMEELKRKLLKFRFEYYWKIDWDTSAILMGPDFENCEPRLLQATNVILAMSSLFPDLHDEYVIFMQEGTEELISELQESKAGYVVLALMSILREEWHSFDKAGLEKILVKPNDISVRIDEMFNYELDARPVGRELKNIGIKTKKQWISDEKASMTKLVLEHDMLYGLQKKYMKNDQWFIPSIPYIPNYWETPTFTEENLEWHEESTLSPINGIDRINGMVKNEDRGVAQETS